MERNMSNDTQKNYKKMSKNSNSTWLIVNKNPVCKLYKQFTEFLL